MNERLQIARRVMRAMRHESAREPLVERNGVGAAQLVVCLPSDTVTYAMDRVRTVGGRATVVVPLGGALMPLGWTIHETAESDSALDDGPIHPESTVGMLAQYLAESGLSRGTFRISADGTEVDVTEGQRLTIPA